MKSYQAIVDESGLRTIWEEQSHRSEFAIQEIYRRRGLLVWAVMSDSVHRQVVLMLNKGLRDDAWRTLQLSSQQIGSLGASESVEQFRLCA